MTAEDKNGLLPSRRDLIVGGASLAAAGVAYARMPRDPLMLIGKDQLDKIIPLKVDNLAY